VNATGLAFRLTVLVTAGAVAEASEPRERVCLRPPHVALATARYQVQLDRRAKVDLSGPAVAVELAPGEHTARIFGDGRQLASFHFTLAPATPLTLDRDDLYDTWRLQRSRPHDCTPLQK
jgi:hypothetical protein